MTADPGNFIAKLMMHVPHLQALGIRFHDAGEDWLELAMPYDEHLVAYPGGVIASGAIFTLMDTAGGMSVYVAVKRFEPNATLDLRLDYIRPAEPGATIVARAHCYKTTRRVAFVRGVAHDGHPDHPVAHASGTFMFTAA